VRCSCLPVKMSLPCQLHDSPPEHTLEPTIPKLVFAASFSSDLVAVFVCVSVRVPTPNRYHHYCHDCCYHCCCHC
jgi:hypothetical protein